MCRTLPIIGEEIRLGDTLIVIDLVSLRKTTNQIIEFLYSLHNEGIYFKSIKEPYFDTDTKEGERGARWINSIRQANKYHLSENSKNIEGSGRKKDSFDKDTELAVLAMYKVNPNVSAIATALNIGSRDTVYRHLKRNNLK